MINSLHAAKAVFYVCLTSSLGLMTGGFFVPPTGVIDGSVLTASGILLSFAALGVWARSIDLGKIAKLTRGNLQVTIGEDQDKMEDSENNEC